MSEKVKSLIIDDEPPARELLRHYLGRIHEIQVIGECSNGFDALKVIREENPQLIFLDIQMPKISGFELLEVLENPPEVIFCTAYDEWAIKAFEMHAVDYLLKPFSEERLQQAVERAVERIKKGRGQLSETNIGIKQIIQSPGKCLTRIIAKTGTTLTVIPVDAIHYLEAQDDYVMVVSDQGNHLKEKPLKFYEEYLPGDVFIRIHRSYIVNIRRIKTISLYGKESYMVKLISGAEIRASASGYRVLKNLL